MELKESGNTTYHVRCSAEKEAYSTKCFTLALRNDIKSVT